MSVFGGNLVRLIISLMFKTLDVGVILAFHVLYVRLRINLLYEVCYARFNPAFL